MVDFNWKWTAAAMFYVMILWLIIRFFGNTRDDL